MFKAGQTCFTGFVTPAFTSRRNEAGGGVNDRISWRCYANVDSDSVGLGWGWGCCVVDQLSEMPMLLATRPHLE